MPLSTAILVSRPSSARGAARLTPYGRVGCVRRIAGDKGRDRGLGSWGHCGFKGLASRHVESSLGRARAQPGAAGAQGALCFYLRLSFAMADVHLWLFPELRGNETRQQRSLKLAEAGWVLCGTARLKHFQGPVPDYHIFPLWSPQMPLLQTWAFTACPYQGLVLSLPRQVLQSSCLISSVGLSITMKSPVIPGSPWEWFPAGFAVAPHTRCAPFL